MTSTPSSETVPLKEDAIRAYLERCIRRWRDEVLSGKNDYAYCYVDAFQSVYASLFGEVLL